MDKLLSAGPEEAIPVPSPVLLRPEDVARLCASGARRSTT